MLVVGYTVHMCNFWTQDIHCIGDILEFATTEQHNKQEISVVGRSGCGLNINMKYAGKGTNAAENSGYLPACSAVVMLKIEARPVCTRMRW